MRNIGHQIIDRIIEGNLVTTTCGHPVVFVWSGNAPEQLEALVEFESELISEVRKDASASGRAQDRALMRCAAAERLIPRLLELAKTSVLRLPGYDDLISETENWMKP